MPAPGNVPGGREGAVSWIDSSANLWLLGGTILPDEHGNINLFNDLWKYSVSSGQWTWVSGSNLNNEPGTYGTQGTPAPGNVPGARQDAVSWTDTSGNLWLFGGNAGPPPIDPAEFMNDLWKYNISSGQWTWVGGSNLINQPGTYGTLGISAPGNLPEARGSAVSWTDTSGNLWLFSGNVGPAFFQINDLWMYTP